MMNLAGREDCDQYIRDELAASWIDIIQGERNRYIVPYSVTGWIGGATLIRAWNYWSVKCMIPLAIAEEMYSNPIGRTDIWVDGQPFCPPPGSWGTEYYDAVGTRLIPEVGVKPMEENLRKYYEKLGYRIISPLPTDARGFVVEYHITTIRGLGFFADTLRHHRLV